MAESRPTQKPEIWRPAFLAVLAEGANVKAACAAAGIGRSAAYLAREKSPDFRRQWDDALGAGRDPLSRARRAPSATTGGTPLDLAPLILAAADEPTPAPNGHHHS